MNPYDWQSHHPRIEIPRPRLVKVAATLAAGGSAVVLGGRGMGKSVFLGQIQAALDGPRVVVIPAPPPQLTVDACLGQLADALGVEPAFNSRKIVDAYFARDGAPERLVLLFDEFDRYAETGDQRSANPPARGFFNDLEATRRDVSGLGVLATGSLGVYVVRDVLGSSFLSRALHLSLLPFERPEVARLARPFDDRGQALTEEVLDAIHLATGGIPALTTFGLQQLWTSSRRPVERDVADVFGDFLEEHDEYVRDLLRSISDPRLSAAPLRVLKTIREDSRPLPRAELEQAIEPRDGPLDLDLTDVLKLLQASGLVRFEGSVVKSNPIVGQPIAGIVNLPSSSLAPEPPLAELLAQDLTRLLTQPHRSSADFFRPAAGGKRLVPEAVFAAYLALGFELLGWQTEREAQNAAGRTDVKLRRNGAGEVAIVEVKIWGRNDYDEAQRQVESYWTAGVVAGAVAQITDAEIDDWPQAYRRRCLGQAASVEARNVADSPIRARLAVTSETVDGLKARVEHFLLRLPRRR